LLRMSGDPTEYREIPDFPLRSLEVVEAGVKVIELFPIPERFWFRNPQALFHPLDFQRYGRIMEME